MSFLREYQTRMADKGHDIYVNGVPYAIEVKRSILWVKSESEGKIPIVFDAMGNILHIKQFLAQECQIKINVHFQQYVENKIDIHKPIKLLEIETVEEVNRKIKEKEKEKEGQANQKKKYNKTYHKY